MECGVLAYLEPSRCLGRLPHLALRVVTKTGLPNLLKHSQTLALQNSDNATFDPTAYRCSFYKVKTYTPLWITTCVMKLVSFAKCRNTPNATQSNSCNQQTTVTIII